MMLALLFSFLPATPHAPRSIPVDMAVAAHSGALAGALREDAMQISITRDGRFFFRSDKVSPEDLPEKIRKGVWNGAERRIYLNADARAKYRDAVAVLDQIRLAGIEDVSLPTQEPYR